MTSPSTIAGMPRDVEPAAPGPRPLRSPATFVGRVAELAAIRDACAAGAAGRPSVVVVVGEAGIGKSTLLAAATADVEGLVVAATGDEAETGLDYGIVDQLLRIAPLEPEVRERLRPGAAIDPIRAGTLLLRTFDELGLDVPLVIVIDDAHLADQPSLKSLTFAARRLRDDRVTVVVAGRPAVHEHLPPGMVRLAERTGGIVDLTGLDRTAVGTLAHGVTGVAFAPAALDRLFTHTDGHPLHTRVLLEQVEPSTFARRGPLPVPRSFSSLVLGQLASCSDVAQRLLVALCVLAEPAWLVDAATVAGVDEPLTAVDELAAEGFVVVEPGVGGGTVSFRHSLIRASVYGDLPAARRAEVHAAAAAISTGAEAVRHRLAASAGPDVVLAGDLAELAAAEVARGSRVAAADHLLDAAALTPDRAGRERHVLRAAELLLDAGSALGPWSEGLASFADTAFRNHVLGRLATAQGDFDGARRLLERAWDQCVADRDASALAGAIAEQLALLGVFTLRPDDVVRWARCAVHAGGDSIAITLLGHGLAMSGDLARARRELDARAAASADSHVARGIVAVWSNELDRAETELQAVLEEHEPSLLHAVDAHAYLADVHLRRGRVTDAIDLAETTVALADDAQAVWLTPLARGVAAFALAAAGSFDRARAHAASAADVAAATGLAPAHIWATHAWFRIAESEYDLAAVVETGDRMVRDGWTSLPEGIHHWRATYVDGLVAADRLDDAGRVAGELIADADRSGDVSVATDAARAAAVVALARGDAGGATEAFERGLALDAGAARPFPRARLELAAGAHARRAGRRTEAAALLRAASSRLAAMGAAPWLERCERELAATGLRPVRRSQPGAASELTSQERVVAGLVAAGRSNREVAAELFISVKTVEHHLSRVYGKLGVRSRSHLAATMRDRPEPEALTDPP